MFGVVYHIDAVVQGVLFVFPIGLFRWQIESQREYHAEPETGNNTKGLRQAVIHQTT